MLKKNYWIHGDTALHPDFNVVTTFSFSLSYLHSHSHQFTPLFPSILLQLCASTIQLGLLDNVRGVSHGSAPHFSALAAPFMSGAGENEGGCFIRVTHCIWQHTIRHYSLWQYSSCLHVATSAAFKLNMMIRNGAQQQSKSWSCSVFATQDFQFFLKKKKRSWTIIPAFIEKKKKITVVYIIIVHQGSDRQRLEII